MRKTSFVCRVFPTDGTLYPEKHITIAYIHRNLRQVIDIRLGEILQFLRTTVTEHTQLLRVQTGTLYLTKTHAAHTGLAHADFHPFATRQYRTGRVGVNTRHHGDAQSQEGYYG